MTNALLLTLLTAYALGMAIMFIVPAGWMPKGNMPDRAINEKGFGRKVFIIGGALIIIIISLLTYLLN